MSHAMTAEQAIKIIEATAVTYPNPDEQDIWDDAIKVAIDALEKQIPKRTIRSRCPICGYTGVRYTCAHKQYCDSCGQALRWSDR